MKSDTSSHQNIQVGSRWAAKNGSRTVIVDAAPPEYILNPWLRVRNCESGRQWNISKETFKKNYFIINP